MHKQAGENKQKTKPNNLQATYKTTSKVFLQFCILMNENRCINIEEEYLWLFVFLQRFGSSLIK